MTKQPPNKERVLVSAPDLAPLEDFLPYLEKIWASKQLTNMGPFHEELEKELAAFLGVKHLALFCNGTTALLTAIKSLEVQGEIITTPFSFVATSHSILWNELEPVFVDIDPESMNLDPKQIEKAITPRTRAILPVHCYGNPCDTEEIQKIADKHGLKLIYDAAHAFGVSDNNGSMVNRGDMSVLSFHATKVFNTFEGGAIVCKDEKTKRIIDLMKNNGIADETTVSMLGLNGKMNELQAAFGLLQLKNIDHAIQARGKIDTTYREALQGVEGVRIPGTPSNVNHNYSYFPILIEENYPESRDQLYQRLKTWGMHGRRYFYPLISRMPMYSGLASAHPDNLPVAEEIASKVICLPIHTDMDQQTAAYIAKLISNQ